MGRTADVFTVSTTSTQAENIKTVLRLRLEEISRCQTDKDSQEVILTKDKCCRVMAKLYDNYLQQQDTQKRRQEVWERAETMAKERKRNDQRSSTTDLYKRSMRSYWKTTVFNRYGGEIWLYTLIATGRVHAISVEIVNEIIADRIRKVANREPTNNPEEAQLRPDVPASPQGQVKGVNHQKCHTHILREDARLADKHTQRHYYDWRKWWSHGAPRRVDRKHDEMKKKADELWDKATEESIKLGNQLKKRDGTMYEPRQKHLGIFEKSLEILLDRINTLQVAWPPP